MAEEGSCQSQGMHLDGVLDLLLELVGDVITVCNVPDARQRRAGCELRVERRQPAVTVPCIICCISILLVPAARHVQQ